MKKRFHAKNKKQENSLLLVKSTEESVLCSKKFPLNYLQGNVVVFDGGIRGETAPSLNSDVPLWSCHKIMDGVLSICDPPSADVGLIYKEDKDAHASFILLPRTDALAINKDGRELCMAMTNISKKQSHVIRGKSKEVFGNHKY